MPVSPALPRVRSLRSALPLLRRPPAPAAVRFKPLTDLGESCQLAAYTDVRYVVDLLNAVCAQHWHALYDELQGSLRATPRRPDDPPMLYVRCALTVFDVTRADVGEGRDGTSNGAGPKAAHSDALKRAAVHFGVNQALYAMRTVWLPVSESSPANCAPTHVYRTRSGHVRVPDQTAERLRELYARWLRAGSGQSFGAPIDLGEDLGAAGLEEEGSGPAAESEVTGRAAALAERPVAAGSVASAIGAARAETPAVRPRPALPATPEQRAAVRHGAHQLGLNAEQLGVLAQLLCGERILERVSSEGLAEIHGVVSSALEAGFAPTAFAYALARAATEPDRVAAAGALRRALEAGGQQAAA
jgi:hypothetical protein